MSVSQSKVKAHVQNLLGIMKINIVQPFYSQQENKRATNPASQKVAILPLFVTGFVSQILKWLKLQC